MWSDGLVPANIPDSDIDPAAGQARDKLVAAAGEWIDRGEIGHATIGAIAEAAGVHRVTFYRHFPDKESLVIEVLERRAAPVLERAAQTLRAVDFFPDGLIEAMATAISEVRTTPGLAAVLGLYPTDDVPHSAGTSDRFLKRAIDITAPHLVLAQHAGLLRRDIPAEDIVEWLMQVCLSNVLLKPHDSLEQTRRQLTRFIVPAIRAD
jgi:AcrR family transcriptional regulator